MKRDLRDFARQTDVRLIGGGVVLIFGLGLVLILWLYGPGAALIGLVCLLAAMMPIGLILGSLYGMDWILKHGRPK